MISKPANTGTFHFPLISSVLFVGRLNGDNPGEEFCCLRIYYLHLFIFKVIMEMLIMQRKTG